MEGEGGGKVSLSQLRPQGSAAVCTLLLRRSVLSRFREHCLSPGIDHDCVSSTRVVQRLSSACWLPCDQSSPTDGPCRALHGWNQSSFIFVRMKTRPPCVQRTGAGASPGRSLEAEGVTLGSDPEETSGAGGRRAKGLQARRCSCLGRVIQPHSERCQDRRDTYKAEKGQGTWKVSPHVHGRPHGSRRPAHLRA